MQTSTKKIDPESRPLSRTLSNKVLKPDSSNRSQRIFRLSFTNLKLKNPAEADLLTSPSNINQEFKDRSAHHQQSQLQLKTIRLDNLVVSNMADMRKLSTPDSNKQPSIRLVKYQPQSPSVQETKVEFKQPELQNKQPELQNKQPLHRRSTTQIHYPRVYVRKQSTENRASNPATPKNFRQLFQGFQIHPSMDEQSRKSSLIPSDDVKASQIFSDSKLEGEFDKSMSPPSPTKNSISHRKTNSMNDSFLKVARMSYSTSVSSHNTLQETQLQSDNKEIDNITRTQRIASDNVSMFNKNFKTIGKIQEAKQKAQLIDDQYIRQSQFLRDDEEEEANFQELCDALNSRL